MVLKESAGSTKLTTAISFDWANQLCIHSDLLQYLLYSCEKEFFKSLHLLPLQTLLPPSIRLFTLICSEVLWYPSVFLDPRYVAPPLIHCTIYASICSPFYKEIEQNQSINKWINAREDKALSSLDKYLSIHVNSWGTIYIKIILIIIIKTEWEGPVFSTIFL